MAKTIEQPHYLNGLEALTLAFNKVEGKSLRQRTKEIVSISQGSQGNFYWSESFYGSTKFIDQNDKKLLLWYGQTATRENEYSFPSLWCQLVPKSYDYKDATNLMRYTMNNKEQQLGFALAHEDMLFPGFMGTTAENTPTNSHCLVELNKLPSNYTSTKKQNSRIPIRKVPDQFEFGRIHPTDPNKVALRIPLILYHPNVVDYIIDMLVGFEDPKK